MKISDAFMRPTILEQDDNYDSFGRGMATQPFQKADSNFDVEVKEFLLKHLRKHGDDIRAIDIQRGRDHGIAGYNSFREFCGLPRATQWDDYLDLISQEVSGMSLHIDD
jgi:peroxidase